MPKEAESKYDVVVIGGGPAGSTAGALLAQQGWRVLLLEKASFPRYHIGESLMPYCYMTLDRLGLIGEMKKHAYTEKHSVQFVSRDGRASNPFYFFQHLDHPAATTWQVPRAEFDLMLLDNARARGVEVREATEVTGFLHEGGQVAGVEARTGDGARREWRARLVIDASGRDAVFQRKRGWRKRDPKLNKVAIWTLFKGAKRDPGLDEGATTVAYLEGKGWFWNIPLKNDIVSAGVVAERDYLYDGTRDLAEIFNREVKRNAWVEDHLSAGRQFGEYWVTGEYTYRSEHCAADGIVLVGDAFAFLDPVFSSGVFLALRSGEMGADAADAALRKGDCSAGAFADYGERLCAGIENMRKLVYAFYDEGFSFKALARKGEGLRGQVTDCLIGRLIDVEYPELFDAIRTMVNLPEPLPHGRVPVAAAGAAAT